MRDTAYFKNKKITIIGLARSGVACANLLFKLGSQVSVTDIAHNAQTQGALKNLCSSKIAVELGKHTLDFIQSADLVVISPGVPLDAVPVVWAKKFNKLVLSEIEVASLLCPAPIIAVSGSNGKTTVTTLIARVIEAAGKKVHLCGNIGNPFSGELGKIAAEDFVVLEVSSFQLENIRDFKPKIAVILNLTANHLDRYKNMQEYLEAKVRITLNQDGGDFLVLNAADLLLKGLEKRSQAKVIYFKQKGNFNPNQSVVLTVGEILGINTDMIIEVFKNFKGLEHRQEEVLELQGIKFINDSKATTADSAIWAIKNISTPIILIAGGRHKGIDYRVILDSAKNKVRKVFLIGEAQEKIAACLQGSLPLEFAPTLEEAVERAYAAASSGDTVLFSPMCSSFDMFLNYEERGRVFKKIVSQLTLMSH